MQFGYSPGIAHLNAHCAEIVKTLVQQRGQCATLAAVMDELQCKGVHLPHAPIDNIPVLGYLWRIQMRAENFVNSFMSLRAIATVRGLEAELVRYLNSLCVESFDVFLQNCGVEAKSGIIPIQRLHRSKLPSSSEVGNSIGNGLNVKIESFRDIGIGDFRSLPIVTRYFGIGKNWVRAFTDNDQFVA